MTTATSVGPKLMDGLRAIDAYQREGMPFADARLEAMGYPPNMADSILRRLHDKGLVESGVSERTGWLTDAGKAMFR